MEMKNLKPLEKEIITCTMCGFCRAVCPVFDKVKWESSVARGKVILSYGLLEKEIDRDDSVLKRIYQCTTCKYCEANCPSNIRVADIVESCRRDFFANDFILPQHRKIVANIRETRNPYGEKKSVLEAFGEKERKADVAYFVGCTSAFREKGIASSMISILKKLKVNYTLIDEACCGSVMQRIGNYDIQNLVDHNVGRMESLGVKKVVLGCAGCYRMFSKEYANYRKINFEVLHSTEFLNGLLSGKELKPFPRKVTYHDPCHLGRHCKFYSPPRELIRKIPEVVFEEMKYHRDKSNCCGSGGGVRSAFPDLAKQISEARLKEAEFADVLLSACPFCVSSLRSAAQSAALKKPEVLDVVELIDRLL